MYVTENGYLMNLTAVLQIKFSYNNLFTILCAIIKVDLDLTASTTMFAFSAQMLVMYFERIFLYFNRIF